MSTQPKCMGSRRRTCRVVSSRAKWNLGLSLYEIRPVHSLLLKLTLAFSLPRGRRKVSESGMTQDRGTKGVFWRPVCVCVWPCEGQPSTIFSRWHMTKFIVSFLWRCMNYVPCCRYAKHIILYMFEKKWINAALHGGSIKVLQYHCNTFSNTNNGNGVPPRNDSWWGLHAWYPQAFSVGVGCVWGLKSSL